MNPWTRRDFLIAMGYSVGAMGLNGLIGCSDSSDEAPDPPPIPKLPFQLGIASGDPMHDRVVIWTRLAPEPLIGGGMPNVDVPVIWEVFADAELRTRLQHGWTWAFAEFGHCVHVDVTGLKPGTHYWYRFRVGDIEFSPVGRTKTFPRPTDHPDRGRFALASCQKYRDGFFTPYPHIASLELDAVIFLGDYIYESKGDTDVDGRLNLENEIVGTIQGFRERYGLYKLEKTLQEAHAAHPWIPVWDDHEVSNNYAGLDFRESRSEQGEPIAVRAAGYQVWWEHMPVRLPTFEDPAHMQIYRRFDFGTLARLCMLDTRQYRDPPPCEEIGQPCQTLLDGGLTILGQEQMNWLEEEFRSSESRWNLIGQQVLLSPVLNELNLANPDQWDGYIDDRQRVLDLFAEVPNVLVLSGDVHAAGFAELYADATDRTSPRVAYEVLTTSIASGGDGADDEARFAPLLERGSPRAHLVDATMRGFTVVDITRDLAEVSYYKVDTVRNGTSIRRQIHRSECGSLVSSASTFTVSLRAR